MIFVPFTDKDFDAYLPGKWQSNVWNRERLEVKQKLVTLARLVGPRLTAVDGSPLDWGASVEHPAIWNQHRVQNQQLYFWRHQAARQELERVLSRKTMASLIEDPSPMRRHVFLFVQVDSSGLTAGLRLHSDASVDRENFQRKCQDYFSREKVINLLHSLPAAFTLRLDNEPGIPASTADEKAVLARARALDEAERWLAVSCPMDRRDSDAKTEAAVSTLDGQLGLLLPIWRFMAWSRENDHVSVKETLKESVIRERSRGLMPRDLVKVLRGVFAGKTGIVESLDSKGAVKLRVGTMAVKVASDEVEKI